MTVASRLQRPLKFAALVSGLLLVALWSCTPEHAAARRYAQTLESCREHAR